MTALAGLWDFGGGPDPARSCERMLAAQLLYGPHGTRIWSGPDIAMGRALYRLLPEDVHDRGPVEAGEGRFVLTADLRLDDREDLCRTLDCGDEAARRLSDAAVLARAWERWSDEVFDHLYGDYAFALWDSREQRLLLARDGLGSRPLHYHQGDGFFAFATMPKGLHALPEIPYAPDEMRVAELLALIPEAGPRSHFAGISRVEPGQVVAVRRDGISTRCHWNPRPAARLRLTADEAAEGLRAELDRAVATRLRGGEGRVGAHLSAGMDSGAVAATAARLLAPTGGQVVAFTSVPRTGYDGPDPPRRFGDEGPLAAAIAAQFPNIEHVLMPTQPGTPLDGLDRDFLLYDRPLVNPCNTVWVTAINAEAKRRRLTVMLNGQMGNMTISYGGIEHLPDLAASGRLLALARLMRGLVRRRHMRWRGALVTAFGRWLPRPLWGLLNRLKGDESLTLDRYSAVNPAQFAALGLAEVARERGLDPDYRPRGDPVGTRLWVIERVDPGVFNKGFLAGWGIDMRDPTADRRLVEYCLALPDGVWIEDGEPRALARRALADRLPQSVLYDRRKGQQAIDWHEGLTAAREGLRQEIERLAEVPTAAAALDLPRMQRLLDDWPTGGWTDPEVVADYRLALLRGIASGHFLRKTSRTNA